MCLLVCVLKRNSYKKKGLKMKHIYGVVILIVSLSQFVAEARMMRRPLDMTKSQNFTKNIAETHPARTYLDAINNAVNNVKTMVTVVDKETGEVKDIEITQSERHELARRSLVVFNILNSSVSSTGQYHLSGVIAAKISEMIGWSSSAREGAKSWMDGFINTESPEAFLPFRDKMGGKNLVVYQSYDGNVRKFEELSQRAQIAAIEEKNRELRKNCRL